MSGESRAAALMIIEGADPEEKRNIDDFRSIRSTYTFGQCRDAWIATRDGKSTGQFAEGLAGWASAFKDNTETQIFNVLLVVEAAYGESLAGNCHTCGDIASELANQCEECIDELVKAINDHGIENGWGMRTCIACQAPLPDTNNNSVLCENCEVRR